MNLRRFREDDLGQVDGDAPVVRASPASLGNQSAPWALPPWHMWGTTETISIPIAGAAQVRLTQQLGRIQYKRPESWHFLFTQRIVSGESPPLLSYGWSTRFNVTTGLGRASVTLPSFWVFSAQIVAPATLPVGQVLWSNIGIRPPGFTGDTGGTLVELVGQDIQISVDVALTSAIFPLQPLVLEVGSFWAPKNHIRPDWFNDFEGVVPAQVFTGGETEGR